MGKEVTVIINKQGQTKVTFKGFFGRICYAEMEKLKQLLKKNGIETQVISQEPTVETQVAVDATVKNVT